MNQLRRPRRSRSNASIRDLVRETHLKSSDLIAPLFVMDGPSARCEVKSMPGIFRLNLDELIKEAQELHALGIRAVALFPLIPDELKTRDARESWNENGIYLRAIRELKKHIPEILVMSDVAMDPYSSQGHDGLVDEQSGEILNDETLEILGRMALAQAKAGADIIGPSDMMDGRVRYLREELDKGGYQKVLIMSYTAKYASAFYGPFRDALDSTPRFGDKKTYQMDYANAREALLEGNLDEEEGADILMVKPGLAYLDVLYRLRQQSTLPLAIYNVSGEYAMIKAAGIQGWIDEKKVMMETLMAMKRAGADVILTYFAKDAAKVLKYEQN